MSERPPGPEYRPDGTVAFVLDDGVVQLRRPKIGELKRLLGAARQLQGEIDDRVAADSAALRSVRDEHDRADTQLAEQVTKAGDADERRRIEEQRGALLAAAKAEQRKLDDAYVQWRDDAYLRWTLEVMDTLGGFTPDDIDELPGWLCSGDLPADLVKHWKSVPSGAGPR